MKLIDKDALVAEIERLYQEHSSKEYIDEAGCVLDKLEDFLDTLEVKEVDYDKALTEYLGNFENASIGQRLSIRRTAKHFFELGFNASNPLTWKDISDIDDLLDESLPSSFGDELELKGYYEEVLKRFKAQKGEQYDNTSR